MDQSALTATNPENAVYKRGGISGSTLKLVAIITMLIDHTAAVVLERILYANGSFNLFPDSLQAFQELITKSGALYVFYIVMRLIGRIAFPIFCFLLVEGFLHTRNVVKYAVRLAAFAIISDIPFDLALSGRMFNRYYQNVFFTLFIGLLVLIGFKLLKEKAADRKWLPIIAVLGAFAVGYEVTRIAINFINGFLNGMNAEGGSLRLLSTKGLILLAILCLLSLLAYFLISVNSSKQSTSLKFADLAVLITGMLLANTLMTDYSGFGVLTIAIMYGLRASHFTSMLGGCITLTVMSASEATCFINLALIRRYNGKRGMNLKYIFYAFYPVHLFILYLICVAMKLV